MLHRRTASASALDPFDDFVKRRRGGTGSRLLGGVLDQRIGQVLRWLEPDLGMKRLDESARLLVGRARHRLPLSAVERGRGKHRRRHGEAVGSEEFEEAQRQRQGGDGARGGGAQVLVDFRGIGADRFKRLGDGRARGVRPGTRDQVDQLPPAHRNVAAVAGRLVQNGQQAIVETHRDVDP
jgi:hypothetical protein